MYIYIYIYRRRENCQGKGKTFNWKPEKCVSWVSVAYLCTILHYQPRGGWLHTTFYHDKQFTCVGNPTFHIFNWAVDPLYIEIDGRGYLAGKVFVNGRGDWGSIPGRVILKTQKWYLIPPCVPFSIIRYVSRVKWGNLEKGVAPSRCRSYWKGRPRVTLDNGRQLYVFIYIYIYIYDFPESYNR